MIVLTHREREPLSFANGTRFEFSSESIADAVARATDLANGADVRVGGGLSTVRSALACGSRRPSARRRPPRDPRPRRPPLGDLRGLDEDYTVTSEVAESGVVHVDLAR